MDYLEGVTDLKNCYYYFMTNTSRDSGKNVANYYDSQRYCQKRIASNYVVDLIRFVDDLQISTIISLFKAGDKRNERKIVKISYFL